MKIIHTSDWHLNNVLGGRCPRNDDLKRSLAQIAQYLDEHAVDVMIVSGDLFRERSRPEQLQAGVEIIKDCFQNFVQHDGTILAISGNHDSEVFFSTLRDAQNLFSPIKEQDGVYPRGRFYITSNSMNIKLQARDGEIVQFVLMPYPTLRRLRKEDSFRFQNIEQRNQFVKSEFMNILRAMQNRLDQRYPAVLVSHVMVTGTATSNDHHLDMSNEVMLEPSDLSFPWSYVALGHLHQAKEAIRNLPHMRYAGSIDRIDYGEHNEDKSVVLLEIKNKHLIQPLELLGLPTTPFYEIEINDPSQEIPELAERYPNGEEALVRYTLHWDSSLHNREQLCKDVEAIFPRWYQRNLIDKQSGVSTGSALTFEQSSDIVGTARNYLQDVLKDRSETERNELLSLAEQLFVEEGLG
ncbi:MAG TPA: exonuclease subunit SbcD [Ktedonobacteraceae bacterium]|nr:exonuclease subunit SbcD [Ktedonobacteraceae bacterium]